MTDITDHGRQTIDQLAQEYGLSTGAVEEMARAVARGGGTMAQFNIPELGGNGQWMAGGMTMAGDMFNYGLKAKIESLCGALAAAMGSAAFFVRPQTVAGAAWWPEDLGSPSSVGGQNEARYAYFPQARRIAFDPGNGRAVILLDTRDHAIGGFSQQQSGPGDPYLGVSFSSQHGQFPLSALQPVGAESRDGKTEPAAPSEPAAPAPEKAEPQPKTEAPASTSVEPPAGAAAPAGQPATGAGVDIIGLIERLAALHAAGVLTDEEFSQKKTELLARL